MVPFTPSQAVFGWQEMRCIGTLDAFNREQVLFQNISTGGNYNNYLKLKKTEQGRMIHAGVAVMQINSFLQILAGTLLHFIL
jgi:hypothetical protein